jgi:hypothetical protein
MTIEEWRAKDGKIIDKEEIKDGKKLSISTRLKPV